MRRVLRALALAALLAARAQAACNFDADFEITNPFDPSCGGVRLTYTENDNSGNHIALGYPVPMPVDSLTPVDGFRSYDSLHAQHQFLMTEHATVNGSVVGYTAEGREIWAYQLGDADATTVDGLPEPAVLLNGGIHAREWQSPEVLTAVFEDLAGRADDDGVGRYLADNVNVVLVPVLNVDGFLQTQRYPDAATADVEQPRDGRMRRKNFVHPTRATPVDEDLDTVEDNFYGTDVNRNSVDGFGLYNGSSDSTTSLVYRGPAPASEPETAALQAAANLGPRARLRLYEDVHSFGAVYLTPQTGNTRHDTLTNALRTQLRAVTAFSYGFGNDPPASRGIGTTADYFAYELQIPAWTLELEPVTSGADYGGTGVSHSGFVLPDSEIARVRAELALTQLLAVYLQSGPPRVAAVQIREVGSNEVVYAANWSAGATRALDVSIARALVPQHDYTLWLAFDRPMRWRDEHGAIADFPGQHVAVFPTIVLEAPGLGAQLTLNGGASAWLNTPGGAPSGYLRYRDDALSVPLQLPAGFDSTQAAPMVLSVTATDFGLAALDADPSTPVDWNGGHWNGYENATGASGDAGGGDCNVQLYTAADADAVPPAATATCAAAAPPPPPPPPPPAPGGSRGGGGGGADFGLLLCCLYAARRRPCSEGTQRC